MGWIKIRDRKKTVPVPDPGVKEHRIPDRRGPQHWSEINIVLPQVCLRVRVPGRAGEAGAVAADGQVLPHAHPGAGVPARRLALRTRRHRQDRVRQGPRLPAGQVKYFQLNFNRNFINYRYF
jgi:hypothetical protein